MCAASGVRKRHALDRYGLLHLVTTNRCVLKTAAEGVARLKTLRLRILAIPAIYGAGGRRPTLRLGIQDRSLRGKFRYWLRQIHGMKLRLLDGIAVGRPATIQP